MGHLIQPLQGPRPLADAQNELMDAHRELVQAGRHAASLLAGLEASAWGIAAKRVRGSPSDQPLNELINQCATVERLPDRPLGSIAANVALASRLGLIVASVERAAQCLCPFR